MSSLSYWIRRQALNTWGYMQSAEDVADQIAKVYQKASGYLSAEANQVFAKFQGKHHLTEKEARQLLNTLRDRASIDELRQALRNAGGPGAASLLAELESPAYQARIERLQQMQNSLDLVMRQVFGQEKRLGTAFYTDLANEAYYKSIFEIQQRAGYGFGFARVDPKVINRILNSKWSGANYSDRIWTNTQALAVSLKEELLINLITGRTNREVAQIIQNKFGSGAMEARRLVRTEACFVAGEMEAISYEECGIEEYRYVAVLDLKTSKPCQELDGKTFKVKDRQPGKNYPPMHPWCRSTTMADIGAEALAKTKRRARDPVTGKSILVPADMTYRDWYKKYVYVEEG